MTSEKILNLVAFSTLIALMGTGCGKSNSNSQQSQEFEDGKYQQASCQYTATDGGSVNADFANSSNIVSTYFGKHFDYAPVEAVMGASIQNTVDYFNSNHGVQIYKVGVSKANCKPFSILQPIPADFKDLWVQASGGIGSGLSIVGLFISKNTDSVPSTQSTAEIGLREDANRWVIVHEFMHSRFDAYVNANGVSSNDLKKEISATLDQLKTYDNASDTDVAALRSMTALVVKLNQDMNEIARRFYLEEVTIETFLQLHYSEFSFMPELLDSSNMYIAVSAKTANEQIDKLSSVLESLRKAAVAAQLNDVANTVLNEMVANSGLQSEIRTTTMLTDAYFTSTDNGLYAKTSLEKTVTPLPFNCGHDHDLEKVNKKFDSVMKKFSKE